MPRAPTRGLDRPTPPGRHRPLHLSPPQPIDPSPRFMRGPAPSPLRCPALACPSPSECSPSGGAVAEPLTGLAALPPPQTHTRAPPTRPATTQSLSISSHQNSCAVHLPVSGHDEATEPRSNDQRLTSARDQSENCRETPDPVQRIRTHPNVPQRLHLQPLLLQKPPSDCENHSEIITNCPPKSHDLLQNTWFPHDSARQRNFLAETRSSRPFGRSHRQPNRPSVIEQIRTDPNAFT